MEPTDGILTRRGIAGLSLLAWACASPAPVAPDRAQALRIEPPAPAAAVRPEEQQETDAEPSGPPEPPCKVAERITNAAIDDAWDRASGIMRELIASGRYTGRKLDGEPDYVVTDWLSCLETPQGAWAIVLERAQLAPQNDYDWTDLWLLDGIVALVHIDHRGRVARQEISTQADPQMSGGDFSRREVFEPAYPNCCSFVFGGLESLELYDFDQDGEPEVHVGASYGHEGSSARSDGLYSFHAGQIAPYPLTEALGFRAMKDETGDGRPELLLMRDLSGGEQCGSGFPADGTGLTFIAHARDDGTFSIDDAEARAFARQQCPMLPPVLTNFEAVLCARLWGQAPAELERRVRATYTAWDCRAELEGRPQRVTARNDYELMLSGASTWVPFTLP